MSEQTVGAIKNLNSSLTEVARAQTKELIKTLAPVKELPSLVETQTKSLLDSMSDNTSAQILIAIAQEKGKLSGGEKLVEEELMQIDRISSELDKKMHSIKQEKSKMMQDIEKDVYNSIDAMDASILNLTRKNFYQSVHLPMQKNVLPSYEENVRVASHSTSNRESWFKGLHEQLSQKLNNYASLLDESSEKASSLAYESKKLEETIAVPIVLVEEQEDETTNKQLFIAPDISSDGTISSQIPWLEEKLEDKELFMANAFRQTIELDALDAYALLALDMEEQTKQEEVTSTETSNNEEIA